MKLIKDVLNVQLFDDKSLTGGTENYNETVKDFIRYTDLKIDDTISKLNTELRLCGIKPLRIK